MKGYLFYFIIVFMISVCIIQIDMPNKYMYNNKAQVR